MPMKERNKRAKQTSARRKLRSEFDALETEFVGIAKDPTKLRVLWARIDSNGNKKISLAEIDKVMVHRYPLLNNKPALMRAYKQTCLKDGGDGDAWIDPPEFPMLLLNLFYFNKLFRLFDDVDVDDDRRLDMKEFEAGVSLLGLGLDSVDAAAEFARVDENGSGHILFDEFCVWYTGKVTFSGSSSSELRLSAPRGLTNDQSPLQTNDQSPLQTNNQSPLQTNNQSPLHSSHMNPRFLEHTALTQCIWLGPGCQGFCW